MKRIEADEYQVSERVVLRPGDVFTVAKGPYWRTGCGNKIPMAVRGQVRFVKAVHEGKRTYLVAVNRDGVVVLHVAGRRRNRLMPEMVCRPYVVKGKKRVARCRPGSRER